MKSLVNAERFFPTEVGNFTGRTNRRAGIKQARDWFIVEEEQRGIQCTIRRDSDLPEGLVRGPEDSGYIGGVLVLDGLTTFSGCYNVARDLRISTRRVTVGGLKDRWAKTAQWAVIQMPWAEYQDHLRRSGPVSGTGYFLKDVVPTFPPMRKDDPEYFRLRDLTPSFGPMSKGDLLANRFTLKVSVPGLKADEIVAYVEPRLQYLAQRGWRFPNAYGNQRLGKRQNLAEIGEELILFGPEKAIRRFICETSPNEKPNATELREQLKEHWSNWEFLREQGMEVDIRQLFDELLGLLEPFHTVLNMDVEYKICKRMAKSGDFWEVMESLPDEFSLWVGAYQSFWFNQVLDRVLRGEVDLTSVLEGLLRRGLKPHEVNAIPMLMFDPFVIDFYREVMPQAIPGVGPEEDPKQVHFSLLQKRVDPRVKNLFMRPRLNRWGKPSVPWRPALIAVQDMEHWAEDGMWHCRFKLRSGGYATTFLGLLFDIDQPEDFTRGEGFRSRRAKQQSSVEPAGDRQSR